MGVLGGITQVVVERSGCGHACSTVATRDKRMALAGAA